MEVLKELSTALQNGDDEKSTGQILRFALPLAFSSGIQQTIPVVIAAIIGRLPDATLALAAFGVVRGLLFLLAGPMRNIQQAYLTLVQNRSDYATLIRFFLRVGVGMGLLTLLVAFPFNQWVLGQALGQFLQHRGQLLEILFLQPTCP